MPGLAGKPTLNSFADRLCKSRVSVGAVTYYNLYFGVAYNRSNPFFIGCLVERDRVAVRVAWPKGQKAKVFWLKVVWLKVVWLKVVWLKVLWLKVVWLKVVWLFGCLVEGCLVEGCSRSVAKGQGCLVVWLLLPRRPLSVRLRVQAK